MALTYVAISTTTVGSTAVPSITFTNIPQTYSDLKIVCSSRDDRAGTQNGVFVTINGSTANFASQEMQFSGSGNGTSPQAARLVGYSVSSTGTSNYFTNFEIYIPDYTNTGVNKTLLSDCAQENNQQTAYLLYGAHLRSSTAAITEVALVPDTANFVQNTTATLYGIKRA